MYNSVYTSIYVFSNGYLMVPGPPALPGLWGTRDVLWNRYSFTNPARWWLQGLQCWHCWLGIVFWRAPTPNYRQSLRFIITCRHGVAQLIVLLSGFFVYIKQRSTNQGCFTLHVQYTHIPWASDILKMVGWDSTNFKCTMLEKVKNNVL